MHDEFFQKKLYLDEFLQALGFISYENGSFYICDDISVAPIGDSLFITQGLPEYEDFREIEIMFPKTISDGIASIKYFFDQEWENESIVSVLEDYIELSKDMDFIEFLMIKPIP